MFKIRSAAERRGVYIWILVALCTLLAAASYTWFSITQRPRVSDMSMYINSPKGLELAGSYDSTEWEQQLDFAELTEETSELKPVTWSAISQCFYAPSYGIDGRMNGRWDKLSDEQNANRADGQGYYSMCTFYARADEPMEVSLTPAMAVNDETEGTGTYVIGTAEWDSESIVHTDGGTGAQYAVRLGFRITPVDADTGTETGDSTFYIYEPNCNRHISETGTRSEETGFRSTGSIDGTEELVDTDHLIRQTASDWSEADPVQRSVVVYEMGEFLTDTELFSIQRGEMVRIDLYVWLEGQDSDCTNALSNQSKILASIQFRGEAGTNGGLEEIPG